MNNVNTFFRKDLNHSYMGLKNVSPSPDVQFHINMLSRNSIPGLLPLSYELLDGDFNCLYDISSKQSLEKLFETEKFSYNALSALSSSLKTLGSILEDYLLDLKYILIQPEFIFTNSERDVFFFCYFPTNNYVNNDQFSDIQVFFNQILAVIDYNDSKAVSLAFNMSRLVQTEGFTLQQLPVSASPMAEITPDEPDTILGDKSSLTLFPTPENLSITPTSLSFWGKIKVYLTGKKFNEIIDDINSGNIIKKIRSINSSNTESDVQVRMKQDNEDPFQINDFDIDEAYLTSKEPSPREIQTVVLDDDTSLNTNFSYTPCLVGTGAQAATIIQLDHFPFTIGKKSGSNNYVIDDPTISRYHCRFYKIGEEYFLEDLNSTNGTFVNEEMLETYTRHALVQGDLIRISLLEYYFR